MNKKTLEGLKLSAAVDAELRKIIQELIRRELAKIQQQDPADFKKLIHLK